MMELTDPQETSDLLARMVLGVSNLVAENARLTLLVTELAKDEPDLTDEQTALADACVQRVREQQARRAEATDRP